MKKNERKCIKAVSICLGVCLLCLVGSKWLAAAEEKYPTKHVEVIICWSPGGFTDMTGRTISSVASQYLGQPMVAISKPGGSGAIGTRYMIEGGPTGYRLLWDMSTQCVTGHLTIKDYPYSLKDFDIIASLSKTERVLAVRKEAPWKTLKELYEYSKKNPGKVKYASSGTGGMGHLAGEMLKEAGKVDWIHIPYQGTATALAGLVGGHVELVTAQPPEVRALVEAGNLRLLVTTSKISEYPDLPTLEETGYGKWYAEQLYPMGAPKGTPKPVLEKLESVFKQVTEDKSFLGLMGKIGANVIFISGAQTTKEYQEWTEVLRPLVQKMGLLAK